MTRSSNRAKRVTHKPAVRGATRVAETVQSGIGAMPSPTEQPVLKPRSRRPARGRGKFLYTEAQIIEGLKAANGVFSDAALYLTEKYGRPVSRPTISRLVHSSSKLQKVVDAIDDVFADECIRQLKRAVKRGSERSVHFTLATRFKHLGFTRSTEITGKDGGPIQTQAPPLDLSHLSNAELAALASLLDKATPAITGTGRRTGSERRATAI